MTNEEKVYIFHKSVDQHASGSQLGKEIIPSLSDEIPSNLAALDMGRAGMNHIENVLLSHFSQGEFQGASNQGGISGVSQCTQGTQFFFMKISSTEDLQHFLVVFFISIGDYLID